MNLPIDWPAFILAAICFGLIIKWVMHVDEIIKLRRFRDIVEDMLCRHDSFDRTFTSNEFAKLIKELDQCLKP